MESYERLVGQTLDGRYKIEEIVGIGGMAVVFRGYDTVTRRRVAIKLLSDHVASDEGAVRRFINESKAVAMLSHPNIVSIYDVSVGGELKYIVMEYLEGVTLKSYMSQKGVLPLSEMLDFCSQILRALVHAHEKGIVHRDIKPQNIMLTPDGTIKVTDFGIAQLPSDESVFESELAIGTAYYISPEQASGQPSDHRSDIYSTGVMMYEMATGRLPFNGKTPSAVAKMQINNVPVPPRRIDPKIPEGLEQIILTAMEKSPKNRFQTAEQMYKWVDAVRRDPNVKFKPLLPPIEEPKIDFGSRRPNRKKRRNYLGRSMLPIILGVAFAFLFACIISAYYIWTEVLFNEERDKSFVVTVDNFIGTEYYIGLEEELAARNYNVVVDYVYDSEIPTGIIISQEPEAGERRRVETGRMSIELNLTVSRGSETFTLPEMIMQDHRNVEQTLTRLYGLRVKLVEEYNLAVASGLVYDTEPEAGTTVTLGDTVTLYVSKGAQLSSKTVPDFGGKTEREARILIEQNDLEVGSVTYEYSAQPAGVVIRQSRVAFTTVPEGTRIDFVVSLGPEPVPETEAPAWPWW